MIVENGEIKAWGWGEHGQLGLGNTCDQTSPQLVSLSHTPNEATAFKVYCGSGFTFVIMTPCNPSQTWYILVEKFDHLSWYRNILQGYIVAAICSKPESLIANVVWFLTASCRASGSTTEGWGGLGLE